MQSRLDFKLPTIIKIDTKKLKYEVQLESQLGNPVSISDNISWNCDHHHCCHQKQR